MITYKSPKVPEFKPPYTTNRFAQSDHILVNDVWKNTIKDYGTTGNTTIETDHKQVWADVYVKMAV